MPRAILFDAGNTLVYADPVRLAEIFRGVGAEVDEEGVQGAELRARRILHESVRRGHAGTEPEVWRGYFERLFLEAGVPGEGMEAAGQRLREAHRRDHLWTGVAPGTHETLEALAEAGHRLAVISNADGRMEALLERVGLTRHFEFVLDSEVAGVAKPDPAIFQAATARLELDAAECLYVGDLYPVDYLGAKGAGLDAVLLDPLGMHGERAETVASLPELPAFVGVGPTRDSS